MGELRRATERPSVTCPAKCEPESPGNASRKKWGCGALSLVTPSVGRCLHAPSGPCQRQRSGSGTDAWQDRFAFERGRAPGGKASRSEALAPSPRHCCSRLRTDPTQRLSRASPPCRRPRSAAGAPSFVGGGDSFTGSEASPPDVERDQGRGPLRWLAMGRQLQVTLVTVTSSTFHDETVNTPALPTKCPKRTRRLALAWAEMSKDCCDHAASCTAG